jgi:hypothetical protein
MPAKVRDRACQGYASGMDEPELDPEKEQKRLDDLGRRIEQTRAEVDADDPATEKTRTFVESGATDEDDDQTIAPPG